MKSILIAYSNPWSFSLAAEREIARRGAKEGRVDVLNLYRLAGRHSPLRRPVDRAAEMLNRKFERFLLPAVNGRDITSGIRAGKLIPPPLPQDLQSLRSYKIGPARVGLSVLSTITSITTVQRPTSMDEYGASLPEAWKSAHLAVEVGLAVRDLGYDEVYIFNGRHCDTRPFCDILEETAQVFRYEQGGSGTRFVTTSGSIHDPMQVVRLIKDHDCDTAVGEKFYQDRLNKAPGNPVSFFTSTQVEGQIPTTAAGNEIVSFFTSSTDEMIAVSDTLAYGEFPSQFEVAMALARACRRQGAQLVVRLHPHLQYKHESWRREWDMVALAGEGAIVLDPSDPTDTYALIHASRCVFTCGSTVGFESVYLNKPCAEVGIRVAGLLGATGLVMNEAEAEAFIAQPALPEHARAETIRFGSYATQGGMPLPELEPGSHPYLARVGGKIADPVRFLIRRVRSTFTKTPYVPLPPGGKIIIEPSVARAMGK
ncbi:MAG TPA: hypothetical protein VIA98_06075 [Allosphingosinicella sp.]|jgi:hypothetical protein